MKYKAVCKHKNGNEVEIKFNDISKFKYLLDLKIFSSIDVYDNKNVRIRNFQDYGNYVVSGALIDGCNILV